MGFDSLEVKRLLRLYMVIPRRPWRRKRFSRTPHLVGSALSNAYYAYSAGMVGLAGPLRGFANQVMAWILEMLEQLGTDEPTDAQIAKYIEQTLIQGRVVPGYGHAVLRITDPLYRSATICRKYIIHDKLINTVNAIYRVALILEATGKIKIRGLMLMLSAAHYWTTTVLLAQFLHRFIWVSRALGVMASLVFDRLYGLPIERPSSQTMEWFMNKSRY